jgi:hypothetical protein
VGRRHLAPGETRDPLGLWEGRAAPIPAGNHPDFLPLEPDFSGPRVRVFHVVRLQDLASE